MDIRIKRVYEAAAEDDGKRVLVDRLWPRGLSKERAQVDVWVKELAPSTELRRWYAHEASKWPEFRARYAAELEDHGEALEALLDLTREGTVTFLFGSKEERLNNATALKEILEARR